ncbi:MAG: hypothetical protein ABI273_13020 [Lacunisphaera sp.]
MALTQRGHLRWNDGEEDFQQTTFFTGNDLFKGGQHFLSYPRVSGQVTTGLDEVMDTLLKCVEIPGGETVASHLEWIFTFGP